MKTQSMPAPSWTALELDDMNAHFADQPPEALLDWAAETYGDTITLTCSFGGPSGMVLLDMVVRAELPIPVTFLDTDLLFPETYALVEQVEQHYAITVRRQRPALSMHEQDRQEGQALYNRDPDRCCTLRKVLPLHDALQPYHAWITGLRRDQSSHRSSTALFQWSERYQRLKLAPLAFWDEKQVWRYIYRHDVPHNSLLAQGYRSLGCVHCTRLPTSDAPRAGRWQGFAKTECGIHL